MSYVVLFAYQIRLNISTRQTVAKINSTKEINYIAISSDRCNVIDLYWARFRVIGHFKYKMNYGRFIKTCLWLGDREVPNSEELPVNYENIVPIQPCEKGLNLKLLKLK